MPRIVSLPHLAPQVAPKVVQLLIRLLSRRRQLRRRRPPRLLRLLHCRLPLARQGRLRLQGTFLRSLPLASGCGEGDRTWSGPGSKMWRGLDAVSGSPLTRVGYMGMVAADCAV